MYKVNNYAKLGREKILQCEINEKKTNWGLNID